MAMTVWKPMFSATYCDGDGHGVPEQVVAEDRRVVLQADPGGITQDAVLGEAEVDAPDGGDEEEKNKADHRREDEEQCDLQVTDPADAELGLVCPVGEVRRAPLVWQGWSSSTLS